MRLDSANRSFVTMMTLAILLSAFVICGALGNVLMPLVLARASREPLDQLLSASVPLLPFLGAVGLSLALAARSAINQALASRRLARLVAAAECELPDWLDHAARIAGLGGRVVLLDSRERFSFAYGMLNPRVAVSRGLIQGVSEAELEAVLEHEHYHVANLDPLKIVLVRAVSAGLFFLPLIESLRARYLATRELAADRRALELCGRRPLLGALEKVIGGPELGELEVAAPLAGGVLHARVSQLETGTEPMLARPDGASAAISLGGAVSLLGAFLFSVSSLGGQAAVHQVTGSGLGSVTVLGSLACMAPLVGLAILAYLLIAARANWPLGAVRPRSHPDVGG